MVTLPAAVPLWVRAARATAPGWGLAANRIDYRLSVGRATPHGGVNVNPVLSTLIP